MHVTRNDHHIETDDDNDNDTRQRKRSFKPFIQKPIISVIQINRNMTFRQAQQLNKIILENTQRKHLLRAI